MRIGVNVARGGGIDLRDGGVGVLVVGRRDNGLAAHFVGVWVRTGDDCGGGGGGVLWWAGAGGVGLGRVVRGFIGTVPARGDFCGGGVRGFGWDGVGVLLAGAVVGLELLQVLLGHLRLSGGGGGKMRGTLHGGLASASAAADAAPGDEGDDDGEDEDDGYDGDAGDGADADGVGGGGGGVGI